MDEQTLQEQTPESSLDAGVVDNLPEDEPVSDIQDREEPEIAVTSDGEVKFSDDFFDDDYGKAPEVSKPEQKPETPNLYSPEELRNTPFEQWEKARLPQEIASYYDAVREQLDTRQKVEQVRNAPMPPVMGSAPQPYTPKDLVADANKLAMERLGITDEMDFEPEYDAEQRAALDLARYELIQQRNQAIATYNQRAGEMRELQDFNARLVSMPDYGAFNQWYENALVKVGKTNEQIQAELTNIAQNYGGRAVISQVMNWYNMYKAEKQQQAKAQKTPRAKVPPQLESTQGGNAGNHKVYNMRDFGNLDADEQAQALMDMGIV